MTADVVQMYREACAWTSTQAMRALELGEAPADVEAVVCGASGAGEPLLSLMFAVERARGAERNAEAHGLSADKLALICDDACNPIREEWSFGIPTDALYPNLP